MAEVSDRCRVFPVAFLKRKNLSREESDEQQAEVWRMKERMKTVSVALVLCLNVGMLPYARLECWIDPLVVSQQKALEVIGLTLQKQYEWWQPRARYKLSLDPTVEDIKKLCISLRKNAKDERVLFHYNGHGVPKPTKNGEIWVFNKTYTQYIPLSVFDLQAWMGVPSIYVWDCNCAGMVIESFRTFGDEIIISVTEIFRGVDCIHLAACMADQVLPMNPELPADLFTSCLTTPIRVAIMWYILQNNLTDKLPLNVVDKIPGQLNDRRTLLGELNWIFTAITDTIAWNTLPKELFQKLFRQDLLVAGLFRNFLLADRVLRSYSCTPVSNPELPTTHEHPIWQAWDYALDVCLSQLNVNALAPHAGGETNGVSGPKFLGGGELPETNDYTHSPFFASQLTAFEVWLKYGHDRRVSPQQLPIVLQVLLSQVHRVRALELLGCFLDLGAWAVNLALSVGIFPYVLKLLQCAAKELRPLLSFIWAKILAVDSGYQTDLIKDGGHRYFLQFLSDPTVSSENKVVPAFVIASILDGNRAGQEAVLQGGYISICSDLLSECKSVLLRQWLTIALGRLWYGYDVARWQGVRCAVHEKLYEMLKDSNCFVRASVVFALGCMVRNGAKQTDEQAVNLVHSIAMTLISVVLNDGSSMARKELVVALHWFVLNFENQFITIVYEMLDEKRSQTEPQKRKTDMNDSMASHGCGSDNLQERRRENSITVAENLNSALLGKTPSLSRQNSFASSPQSPASGKSLITYFTVSDRTTYLTVLFFVCFLTDNG
ncbi:unnamed protein product [Soboliphyme baturini]|uniref:Raptor_N domain-containing protein n=1 Tax=Soboliphyme baturini TaxID=241478 RepID=A0A183ITA8_9BILA|nr:unnamed protein product [Soboliphyme baturini]